MPWPSSTPGSPTSRSPTPATDRTGTRRRWAPERVPTGAAGALGLGSGGHADAGEVLLERRQVDGEHPVVDVKVDRPPEAHVLHLDQTSQLTRGRLEVAPGV